MWKEIPDTNGNYSANSETGQIRSNDRLGYDGRRLKGKLIKPYTINSGYDVVYLRVNGKKYDTLVHRAIAKTFLSNYDESLQINHKDCNKRNNKLENLEVVTRSENIRHAINNGLINFYTPTKLETYKRFGQRTRERCSKEIQQLNKDTKEVIAVFSSVVEASTVTGISAYDIYDAATGRRNPTNFSWCYTESMKCND